MDQLRFILIIVGLFIVALIYFISRRSRNSQGSDSGESVQKDTEWMEEIARQRRKHDNPEPPQSFDDAQPHVPVLDDVVVETANDTTLQALQPEAKPTALGSDDPWAETGSVEQDPSLSAEQLAPTKPHLPLEEESTPSPVAETRELVLVLHITAPEEMTFVGATLFSALEETGLRFGEGGIFHYYHSSENEDSRDTVLFSIANMLEPGTFEGGQTEQEFNTPGVVLFMHAPGLLPAREITEKMLTTAQRLAQLIGGEIRDEARNKLTESTIKSLLERASVFDHKS